jgi:methylated-DNA-[protein]-cysteine S-methyltransferase
MNMISVFNTDLRYIALATLDGEVVGLAFGHPSESAARKSLERFHASTGSKILKEALQENCSETAFFNDRVVDRLKQFAGGEAVDFDDIAIATAGMTKFQVQVVAACRAIPWGVTVSYGQLAAAVGHPGAARAVGTVMSKNRVPLIVPCHRVLASGGQLGGYSAPQGLAMKRRLLELEKQEQLAAVI